MNKIRAKKIIFELIKEWRLGKTRPLLGMVDFLDKETNKKLSFSNDFEFSFIENETQIRLLHLNFWQQNLPIPIIKKIIKKRETVIVSIFTQLSQKFNCFYNLSLLQSFFQFNKETGFWPIQFGLEYNGKSKPKIKIYLSINDDDFHLKKFCDKFKLNYKILKKEFRNKKFDTAAIDFLLSNGDYGFKFYPIIALNKGKLYRVDKNTNIISIKNWTRFPDGLLVNDKIVSNFIKLPAFLYEIIKKNNFRIHYLCEENNKKSIYFR